MNSTGVAGSALHIEGGALSVAGRKAENQDAVAIHRPDGEALRSKGVVALVADGVSHCARAAEASRACATAVVGDYYSTPESWSVERAMSRVLNALNSWLFGSGGQARRQSDSLATTLSLLVIKSTTAHLFHVGDSRIYRWRDGQLEQLTRDHLLRDASGRAILTRALGIDSHLEVDYRQEALQQGDRYLLLTDGISSVIEHGHLQVLLAEGREPQLLCDQLVAAALAAGSDDNLSAVVVEIRALPLPEAEETRRGLGQRVIPPVMAAGQRLDGYRVLRVLFAGTRSHLYLVEDGEGGPRYALKAPSLNFSEDLSYLEGFVHEGWVGQKLTHPNLMKIYPRRDSPFLYHLCEYIEGSDLRQWALDHPSPPIDQLRPVARQLVSALRALQRAQMVHRDLKPENVLLSHDGHLKLIDYGTVYSAAFGDERAAVAEVPVGSLHYIAPEYLLGQPATAQSDLFSLAVILYELLAGKRPFADTDFRYRQPRSFSDWHYQPLRHQRPDLPLWLDLALQQGCAPNPRLRTAAFSELLANLDHPNPQLLARHQHEPLLERHPLQVWQAIALVLLLLNLLQLAWQVL